MNMRRVLEGLVETCNKTTGRSGYDTGGCRQKNTGSQWIGFEGTQIITIGFFGRLG